MVLSTRRSSFLYDPHVLRSCFEQYTSAVSNILVHAPCTAEGHILPSTWPCYKRAIDG
jgi:hypothetical protein